MKKTEYPGFRNPLAVVPVVSPDLVPSPNVGVDHSFHLAKDVNPRVVTLVLRSALRSERHESPVGQLGSNEAAYKQS
jgi:hypothetical protein